MLTLNRSSDEYNRRLCYFSAEKILGIRCKSLLTGTKGLVKEFDEWGLVIIYWDNGKTSRVRIRDLEYVVRAEEDMVATSGAI